ncbi:MAG: hypothetical protein GFH27_549281n354 [Chloroflexi bacterium AL-W]|nr:hypothetical protein [Chloroflexi bacterium AL-N1]NOK66239.1 hypothetical protein [Chloroflexi bacterium AL-N10]NOK73120.1 hypothetical protein [Chloroflexi bacterium AL-N5]NOK80017.1 hypothetical protein [Chloroflexi bacterium AL-W]NOK88127.1 hypothetical protein [Chloroflexi bacterium AL-N15]
MRMGNVLRIVISSWAVVLALAVSVVPVGGAVSGGLFGDPAPMSEQTHLEPNGAPGNCRECHRD